MDCRIVNHLIVPENKEPKDRVLAFLLSFYEPGSETNLCAGLCLTTKNQQRKGIFPRLLYFFRQFFSLNKKKNVVKFFQVNLYS